MIEPTWRPAALEGWCAPGGPLADAGTLDALFAAADASPDVLLVDGGRRVSGTSLAGIVARVAGWLTTLGVERGDVVVWQLPNCWESVALYRACWRLGATAAPLHHQAGAADVASLVDSLRPRLAVAAADLPLADAPPPPNDQGTHPPTGPSAGHSEGFASPPPNDQGTHPPAGATPVHSEGVVVLGDAGALEALVAESAPVADDRARPADVAVVLHTSGSSGTPKGVIHTHRALAHKARLMADVHGLTPTSCVLMPAPLAHISGLLNGVLVPGARPFRSVLMRRWDAGAALGLIRDERVTFMVGPPTFFLGLEAAEGFSADAVASLHTVSAGGAGVTPAFVARTTEVFDAVVKRSYGSTEAPTVTTAPVWDDDPETRETTDGHPVGAVALRIVDPTSGATLATGERGEIQVSGPELFAGYTDPERTAEATDGDWYRTGDLGVLDGAGRLTVVGRLADTIIRGGENIAAAEVEATLEAHPAVRHAVAVAEPDERLGERVCAFVEVSSPFDLETCRAWFAERGVARYRTPERVVVVEGLPLLGSGKPDRAVLRRRAAALASGR